MSRLYKNLKIISMCCTLFLLFTAEISAAGKIKKIKEGGHRPMPLPSDHTMGLPVPDGNYQLSPEQQGDRDKIGLEYVKGVMMKAVTEVYVPLEIISDIHIEALIIDDQEVIVPFELETNKVPEVLNRYKVKYSETEIDIDKDGVVDTFIYSSKYINEKIIKDNYVVFQGRGISKEGKHEKIVYINIEIDD